MNQMIRQGKVTQTFPETGKVRVEFPDSDGVESKILPVLFKRTIDNCDYDMPDKGEQVVCIVLANGMEQGFVIGSPYSDPEADKTPVDDQDKKHYKWKDGTFFEYDRKKHHGVLDMREPDGVFEIFTGTTHIRIEPHHVYIRADRIDENDDR